MQVIAWLKCNSRLALPNHTALQGKRIANADLAELNHAAFASITKVSLGRLAAKRADANADLMGQVEQQARSEEVGEEGPFVVGSTWQAAEEGKEQHDLLPRHQCMYLSIWVRRTGCTRLLPSPLPAHSHAQVEAALASLSLSSLPDEPDVGCCAISCLTYQEALQASLCSLPG